MRRRGLGVMVAAMLLHEAGWAGYDVHSVFTDKILYKPRVLVSLWQRLGVLDVCLIRNEWKHVIIVCRLGG